jgi:ribose/xylose/arabinose/galactoside ABC-type transport system permease subunit
MHLSDIKGAFSDEKIIHYSILIVISILMVVIFSYLNPLFLTMFSLVNIVRTISIVAIVGIGMTMVVLTGGMDLSVGSNLAFSGACLGLVYRMTSNIPLSFLAAIIGGVLIGILNGFIVGKLKINAIVATLATMGIARSLTLVLLDGNPFRIIDGTLKWIANSTLGKGSSGVPTIIVFVIILYIIFHFILKNTVIGKNLYATGGNIRAASVSGIKVNNVVMLAYVVTGFLTGLTAIYATARTASAIPWGGLNMEFDAVTVVIMGGASLAGGKGDLIGTCLGVILLGIMMYGLGILDISPFSKYIAKGLLLLAAILLNKYLIKEG